jgi:ethanolamine ammonia-lyase large subunit
MNRIGACVFVTRSEQAMSQFSHMTGPRTYIFADLRELMARATPARSGDRLAGVAASSAEERVAAQMALAERRLRDPGECPRGA